MTSHTDFNSQLTQYDYDELNRTTEIRYSDGNVERFEYDDVGNRIKETQLTGAVLAYTYDAVGNKTSLTVRYKNGDVRIEQYTCDALNRLTSVTDNQGQTTTFEYDAVGNQTHIRYPNGLVSVSTFDSLNRVTSITTLDADDNVLTHYAYELDATGRRTSLTEHTGRVSTFSYDDLYRLSNESIVDPINGDHNSSYTYDATGNRTQSIINGITTEYEYDANDRLISQGAFTYTYDAQGNMLSETDGVNTKTYSYDANQRMIGFNDGTQSITYEYNPDGIRVSKNVDGTQTQFIVDSNRDYAQVIAEQVNNTDIQKEYVFGYDLLSQSSLTDIGDEPQTNTAFYHYDSLGTTRNLSNTDASISDSYFYEAFGELLASDGDTDNDYLYTGEQYDAQLDNYYLRARYYNQGVGRFTQMDTWMGKDIEPITLNKYLYGHSEPLNGVDPSGFMFLTDISFTSSLQAKNRAGQTAGYRVTFKKLRKELVCASIKEVAVKSISEAAAGVYLFSERLSGETYIGKTDNFKRRETQHNARIGKMLAKIEFKMDNVLELFGIDKKSTEAKAFDNALRALEQSFMDEYDRVGAQTSNRMRSVAKQPKSLNSQKIRRMLNNTIDLCPEGAL
ncbi:GIY-YIG nuclease family protein [Glaciecola sp. MH2013]|nr:GIY-YIG nuclease family protein [Glaciecola sp. MH2013]